MSLKKYYNFKKVGGSGNLDLLLIKDIKMLENVLNEIKNLNIEKNTPITIKIIPSFENRIKTKSHEIFRWSNKYLLISIKTKDIDFILRTL